MSDRDTSVALKALVFRAFLLPVRVHESACRGIVVGPCQGTACASGEAVWGTMTFAVLGVAALGIGVTVLRPLRGASRIEHGLFGLLLGLVACAIWSIAAGSYSLSIAYFGVTLFSVVFSAVFLATLSRHTSNSGRSPLLSFRASRVWPTQSLRDLDILERLSVAVIFGSLLMALVSALAPVTNWDAGAAHLALPAEYARAGSIGVLEANNYSAYPHLAHALFTMSYGRGSEMGVGLLSWLFTVLGIGFAFCLGMRLANRKAGLIGAAALATAPIFADQAGTPSIDLAFASMVLAAIVALIAWRQERYGAWLVLAGVLAGSACGVRHTGYLTAVLLSAGVLIGAPSHRVRWSMAFGLAVLLGAAPWLIRTWWTVGNPFYPFFASVFGSWGTFDADVASLGTHDSMRAWGYLDFVRFPWSVVMAPDAFDGWSSNPGMLVLLLGVPGIIYGGRRAVLIGLFCLIGISALFFFRQHVRYLLPFFLPMMVLAGVGAVRTPFARRAVSGVVVCALVFGLGVQAAAVHYKVPVALGIEPRDVYLNKRIERYSAFEWVRENLPDDAVVLSLDPRGYYFDRSCYQNFESLKALVGANSAVDENWLNRHKIDYLFYPDDYVMQSPGFRETGVLTVVDRWRADRDQFALIASLEVERARGDGTELVEIYRVRRNHDAIARRSED